ncbi:unnamed protein product [Durusdinium trenchii]|uniref:Uncharacterized protein n=1 Tax=Durusdinium trenchii TaxID=1381693 RepID=A0ABP0H7R7_9DINO
MPGDDAALELEVGALDEQIKKTRSAAERAENKRARLRAKEKRKKIKKKDKIRAEKEAQGQRQPKAVGTNDVPGKRARKRKQDVEDRVPEAGPTAGEESPVQRRAPLAEQIGREGTRTPETAAPRRPTLLDVPTTPLGDLPPLTPQSSWSDDQAELDLARPRNDALIEKSPPSCVATFAALARHVADELPADSSARRNAVTKVARSLKCLPLADLNFLIREVQLSMMEKTGSSRASKLKVLPQAEGEFSAVSPCVDGDDPEMQRVKAVCKFTRPMCKENLADVKSYSTFVDEMLKAAPPAETWQAAWQYFALSKLSAEEDRDEANHMLVTTMLAFSANPAYSARLTRALADLVRSHKIRLRVFIEAVNDAVAQIRGRIRNEPELMEEVIPSLLAYLYPAVSPNSRGTHSWYRPGWIFRDWMKMVNSLLGNLEELCVLELLDKVLKLLEALPDGQVHQLSKLREFLDTVGESNPEQASAEKLQVEMQNLEDRRSS